MSIDIIVPDLGEDGKFPVIEILTNPGDTVATDDGVILLESDKASMEVPAPADGQILTLTVQVGDEIGTGDVIGTLSGEGAVADTAPTPEKEVAPAPIEKATAPSPTPEKEVAPAPVEKATAPSPAPATSAPVTTIDENTFRNAHASPSIRKLARELGADLGKVKSTGRKERITEQDVKNHVKAILTGASSAQGATGGSGIPPIPAQDFSKFGEVEEHKLGKINILTGAHMTRCWLNIPHVTQYDEADITDIEDFRKSLKAEAEKLGVRVSMLSFLMKIVASGLKAYPRFNSSLSADGQSLIMKKYYNIGIAVDTPNGLVVPVIKDVDKKSIYELSQDMMTMSKKARDGKLMPSDMSGGSITISSLGGIGGTAFTPIVNAPEVAILGVSRSKMTPVWNGKEFEPRNMLPMSLSYDHRVIDGADGARFTRHIATMLEDFRRVML